MDNYVPAKELAARASESPQKTSALTIKAIRDQVLVKFETQEIGNLLSKYHVDRDKQMETLCALGKDVLLSLLSQGILPATLAEAFEVSYDVFYEFMHITCSKDEIKHMKELQADSFVADSLKQLEAAEDKDDLAQAKAIADFKMKLAKAQSSRYQEQKPTTAVQVNNYNSDGSMEERSFVAFPQMTIPMTDELPDLPPHQHKVEKETKQHHFEPEGVIDGEFAIYNGED